MGQLSNLIESFKMKSIITATILAFTITHATAQSMTCRPVGANTVCTPTPAGGGAGIGPALVVLGVLWLITGYLKTNQTEKSGDE
jgi:hypothetical protein